jgi:protocatechuate 3,4-dioxygenase beta subunit
MDRKKFLRRGVLGFGSLVTIPTLLTSCDNAAVDPNACEPSPTEMAGPFPIKSPADWVRANVIGNRNGVALMINLTIQNTKNNCEPLAGVFVDIWQCDADGNYSEYNDQLDGNFTNEHFLRGRQTTDVNGNVSFISIYPGWYPGRAPHIHFEVLDSDGKSLLIGQTAFPDDISKTVYTDTNYKGEADTSNEMDSLFDGSLAGNLANSVTGNNTDGYILNTIIKVKG